MTGTVPNFKLFPKFIEKYLSYNELLSTVAICTKTVLPYKHTACIRRCNDVETTVSTSFKRRIHVVFLQEYFFAFCFLVIYRFRSTCLIICTALNYLKSFFGLYFLVLRKSLYLARVQENIDQKKLLI